MRIFRSEQHATWRRKRLLAALLASSLLGGAALTSVLADSPPAPDFFWPYGRVQLNGTNISPEVQPVIAFVNGKACGFAQTQVAQPVPDTPPGDIGKTVYVVDVLADGNAQGERPGCGHTGDAVVLYFPLIHRIAGQQPSFRQGGLRVDLDLGPALSYQLSAPMLAGDGTN